MSLALTISLLSYANAPSVKPIAALKARLKLLKGVVMPLDLNHP
jgi:hypothetical protein